MEAINRTLAKVVKRAKELKKLVNESSKTKIEIKQAAREMEYLVGNLEKSIVQSRKDLVCPTEKREVEKVDMKTQTRPFSIGVQADWNDIELERQQVESKLILYHWYGIREVSWAWGPSWTWNGRKICTPLRSSSPLT